MSSSTLEIGAIQPNWAGVDGNNSSNVSKISLVTSSISAQLGWIAPFSSVEEDNQSSKVEIAEVSLVDESGSSEAVVEEEYDEVEVKVQVEESSTASVESVDEAENVTDDVDTNNEDEALLEEHATFDSHDKVDDTNVLSPDSINDGNNFQCRRRQPIF